MVSYSPYWYRIKDTKIKEPLSIYNRLPGFDLSVNKPMCFKKPKLINDKYGNREFGDLLNYTSGDSTLNTEGREDDTPLYRKKVRFDRRNYITQ